MRTEPQNTREEKKGNMVTLNSEVLRRAADLSDEIAGKQAELNQLLAGQIAVDSATISTSPTQTRMLRTADGKRKFTPESRERIAAAQRRRWKNAKKLANQAAALAAATAAQAAHATVPAPAAPAPAPVAPAAKQEAVAA